MIKVKISNYIYLQIIKKYSLIFLLYNFNRYDCDFNNEPCLKNGATAHWAVLCGYVDGGNTENFYVLACHGKSRYVSAWRFSDLQLSNDNLNDIGTKRKLDDRNYIIPVGGLKSGISSKWILFERKK